MKRKIFLAILIAAAAVVILANVAQAAEESRIMFQFEIGESEEVRVEIVDSADRIVGRALCPGTALCVSSPLAPGNYGLKYYLRHVEELPAYPGMRPSQSLVWDRKPRETGTVKIKEGEDVLLTEIRIRGAGRSAGYSRPKDMEEKATSTTTAQVKPEVKEQPIAQQQQAKPTGDRDADGVPDDKDVMPELGILGQDIRVQIKVQRFDEKKGWRYSLETVLVADFGVTADGRPTLALRWCDAAEVESVDPDLVHWRPEWESAVKAFGEAIQAFNDRQWELAHKQSLEQETTIILPLVEASVLGQEDVIHYSAQSRVGAREMTRTLIDYAGMISDADVFGRHTRANARLVSVSDEFEKYLDRQFVSRKGIEIRAPEGVRGAEVEAQLANQKAVARYTATQVASKGGECCKSPFDGDLILGGYGLLSNHTGQLGGMAMGVFTYKRIGAYAMGNMGWDFQLEGHHTRALMASVGLLGRVYENGDEENGKETSCLIDLYGGYLRRAANFSGDGEVYFNNYGGILGARFEFWQWFNLGVQLELTQLRDSYHRRSTHDEWTYDDEHHKYKNVMEFGGEVWVGVDLIGAYRKLFGDETQP